MTLKIILPPEDEKRLADRAAASGQDIAEYIHGLIKKDIDQLSFAELFAPVHQAVRDSKISEPELNSLIQTAISESRNQKRRRESQ